MKLKSVLFTLMFAAVITAVNSTTASAQYRAAIITENNNCLIPDSNRVLRVFPCSYGGVRYNISNGFIRTVDGYCLDHGIPKGVNPSGGDPSIKLVPCHGGKSQQWYFGTGRNTGLVQNAANTDVCMNLERGNDSQGTKVIVWGCGFNNPAANERFYVGEQLTAYHVSQLTFLQTGILNHVRNGGSVVFSNGSRMVAAGGGNMVAAGAGNVLPSGAGGLIGNSGNTLVGNSGNTMVAAGAGNLIGQDGGSLRTFLSGGRGAALR